MTDTLFAESGARWRTIAYGPLFCLAVAFYEIVAGGGVHWVALAIAAVIMATVVWVQVLGGRRYVSVELTPTTLRNGPEELDLADIDHVFPERDKDSWDDELWEVARAMGELSDVPRGRTGIGLRLRSGVLLRTWAKNDKGLRAALLTARPDLADESESEPK
ncbi:hypothetical protein [Antrihabitans cavernicola]|uniref:DUF3093 domain-containing protein n=1 Tax=Antrihabitans cavernicola TaxID=2495913 RepID=A0A5A7SAM6_9NOCA|nr:hypothetical protein [Spelaeibacter cavernicola]KAA0022359.1 hypothetical protein FOY51_15445 [Spelaeibacter cavernicola]